MTKIQFLIQGSSNEPYELDFQFVNSKITAVCTCNAGAFGTVCKHKLNIINGSTDSIIGNNQCEVDTVLSWISISNLSPLLESLRAAEDQLEKAKKTVKQAKDNIKTALS